VRVGHDLLAESGVAILLGPGLGEGQEKLLIARQTVHNGRWLTRE
jgi:hypothetical protein